MRIPSALVVCLCLSVPAAAQGEQWPGWRGPARNGTSAASELPLTWSAEDNVIWKTALPSWSGATPVIFGSRIFVMTPSAVDPEAQQAREEEAAEEQGGGRRGRRGRRGGGRHPGGDDMLLLCLSADDGSLLWKTKLDEGNALHRKGNNSSPSPVTDGTHVWTVTGNGTVSALDLEGEVLWSHNLQQRWGEFGLMWGYASSPILFDGKVVVQVLHGMRTDEPSYLVAFDGKSGEVVWRVERPTDAPSESPDAYTTPALLQVGDQTQIIVSGGDYVTGHDPATGEELWRVAGLNPNAARNYRIIASALVLDDLIVAPTRQRPLTAIRVDAEGRPTEDSIAWQWNESGGPDVPTPTTDGEYIYLVDDSGLVTCVDPATGKAVWGPERTVSGTVSASPLCVDGKLYVTDEEGVTAVLATGEEFQQLALNELDGSYTISSPIALGNRLYLRTEKFLYCIGQASEKQD